MVSFATAAQYKAVYSTSLEDDRLQAKLDRASRDIAAELRHAGISYGNPNEEFAADLADVCISMVHRSIGDEKASDSSIPFGATQFSQGAGSYTASATLANPYGDVFMTKAERRKLGIIRSRAGFASPFGGGSDA